MKQKTLIITPKAARDLCPKAEIAANKAYAAGSKVGFRCETLDFFPKIPFDHEDGFNFHDSDMDFTPSQLTKFKHEAWFSYKEAERRGLSVVIECKSKSIMPMASDFFVESSVIDHIPDTANDN